MSSPIIFIHYSDSYYLKYSLESAVIFNPDKQVILLGDSTNSHYSKLGITHYDLNDFSAGPESDLFDEVYQFIAGTQHDRREWTRFVFKRWFIIYNFISTNNIQKFWTFDSDNLILTTLSNQEEKFMDYDCTEQCSGICMNGLVTSIDVVKGYINKINELFQRALFLEQEKQSLKKFPRYAFTEMKAYVKYRDESNIKRTRLNAIIHGETFLDSICTVEEHKIYFDEDHYELYDEKLWRHELKKIYLHSDGNIFMRHKPSNQLVKMLTINMSWTPGWLFDALLKHSKIKLQKKGPLIENKQKIKTFDLGKYIKRFEFDSR